MNNDLKIVLGVIVVFVLIISIVSFRGVFVSSTKALQAAEVQLGVDNLQLSNKHIMFVHWRGCDKGDVAMFNVLSFKNAQGKTVNNAIVCSGWPFKGITVRFK